MIYCQLQEVGIDKIFQYLYISCSALYNSVLNTCLYLIILRYVALDTYTLSMHVFMIFGFVLTPLSILNLEQPRSIIVNWIASKPKRYET